MELEMSFQTAKYVCFAMDLMTNDLAYFIDNEYEYCLENARRWSAQVALGINALHAMGIIHRDIKSENILIDIQENVRIADFGLSHIDKEPKPLHAWRGYSSEVKGTIDFMAPEILRNVKEPLSVKYGAPVDWWAFGCVIYELVSPPNYKARIASYLLVVLLISPRQELFVSEDDITNGLIQFAGDLVAKLLNPLVELRFGFQQVTNHRYFSNGDGTSEFHGACSRAVRREEQPEMLPSLWDVSDEEPLRVKVWRPLPPERPEHISNIDWKKPSL
ncbi:kinase-like domain-containing protein [Suillus occidentalis]|nr:kinase-like domain-containing protein [Suillus occidentalis]